MINTISSWVGQIVIAIVVVTILEMILPNSNNKKYIKTVIGIYILFIIIHPITTNLFKGNLNLNAILTSYSVQNEVINEDKFAIKTNNQVEKLYIKEIEKEITEEINEQGYKVENIKAEVSIDNGKINNLKIIISKIKNEEEEKMNNIIIEPINIQLSKNEVNKVEKSISEEEFEKIKEALKENYKIEKEKIIIEEE